MIATGEGWTLYQGDCLDVIGSLPDASFDAIITDPPYPGIRREYGYWEPDEWLDMMRLLVPELRRVLKPSGSCVMVLQPNSERAGQGLGALATDPALTNIARSHNQWMDEHNCFAHECPGEETVWQRLARAGYANAAGSEVIARGYDTVESLVNGWLGSPAHRAILLGSYSHIGCAWDEFDAGYMGRWMTCDVGRRNGAAPTPTPTPRRPNSAWPPGWFLVVEVPYDTSTQGQIDQLYRDLCAGRAADGVRCVWHRYRSLEGP